MIRGLKDLKPKRLLESERREEGQATYTSTWLALMIRGDGYCSCLKTWCHAICLLMDVLQPQTRRRCELLSCKCSPRTMLCCKSDVLSFSSLCPCSQRSRRNRKCCRSPHFLRSWRPIDSPKALNLLLLPLVALLSFGD